MDSLYLAYRYLRYNLARSVILVCCITICISLPLVLQILLNESERQLNQRAETTPLLLGTKSSSLDLVMNSLYFSNADPGSMKFAAVEEIADHQLADAIPLYIRFKARGFPIVATSIDYFGYRDLKFAQGEMFTFLGECVIGHTVASQLNLTVGDHLVSSPETLFDLAGVYPLKMRVAGVLVPSHSADDVAVFVDIKTGWVINGLGHGHEDLNRTTDSSVILRKDGDTVVANAKLMEYMEITRDNIDSFHLHGDPGTFPLTAAIVLPFSDKDSAILQGRYLTDTPYQLVEPQETVNSLLATIFRIHTVLDAIIILVGLATLLALVLVFSLSLKLRQKELETNFRLGSSKATTARLLGAEILIILVACALLTSAIGGITGYFDHTLVRSIIL